jgi:hypothetical protein
MDDLDLSVSLVIGETWHTGEHPSYPDAHLQSPIRLVTTSCINESKQRIQRFLRPTIGNIPPEVHPRKFESEDFYGYIFSNSTTPRDETQVSSWVDKTIVRH